MKKDPVKTLPIPDAMARQKRELIWNKDTMDFDILYNTTAIVEDKTLLQQKAFSLQKGPNPRREIIRWPCPPPKSANLYSGWQSQELSPNFEVDLDELLSSTPPTTK